MLLGPGTPVSLTRGALARTPNACVDRLPLPMPVTPSVSSGKQHAGGNGLVGEVERLREQLAREKAETGATLDQYSNAIDRITAENHQMQVSIQRWDNKEPTQSHEMMHLKSAVLDNSAAIEKVMLEFQQQQQATVARIKSLTNAMLSSCATSPAAQGIDVCVSAGTGHARTSDAKLSSTSLNSLTQGCNIAAAGGAPGGNGTQKWLQSVKANLEHFGDVEVFNDSSPHDCECCMEPILTDYRVRPRRCNHTFHVECLLQLWSDGQCPVCGVSFAPE